MLDNPRLAVVGCGYWGSKHVRVISQMLSAQLALAVDARPERLDYISATYSVTVSDQFEAALGPEIDGVVLATPISSHYALARQALLAGKHVLVEKPLATSTAECRELLALAERSDTTLMVGHTFEYHPAVEYLRAIIERGELGRIYYVDCARLNLGLFQQDSDALWDLAPHDLSIIHYILGETAHSISATGSNHILSGSADVAYANMSFSGGASAHLHVSWLDPCKVRRVTVVGSKAMVVFNDVAVSEKIRIYDKRFTYSSTGDHYFDFQSGYHHGNVVIPAIGTAEPLMRELEDFATAIRTGSPVRADGRSGLRVVQALEAASRSMTASGRVEPLREPDARSIEPGARTILAPAHANGNQAGVVGG